MSAVARHTIGRTSRRLNNLSGNPTRSLKRTSTKGADATRERWLLDAGRRLITEHLEPWEVGVKDFRISCSWPSRKALSGATRRRGECWDPTAVPDAVPQLFISPTMDQPVDVLGVVLHELIHAAGYKGHGRAFQKIAFGVGFVPPASTTPFGPELEARLHTLAAQLGPYPHVALTALARSRNDSRLRLYECACDPVVKIRAATDELLAICGHWRQGFVLHARP
jgi:hypothetical protein